MIYLDNAATTEPKFHRNGIGYNEYWFNSNTPYAKTEGEALAYAEAKIKGLLHVTGGHVLYFRCATEAVEWLVTAINSGRVGCSKFSHDSVERRAFTNLDTNYLTVYIDQFINPITGDNVRHNADIPHTIFYGCDYTASIGHAILPENPKYDFIFFSGHKFYTEKGIGAMWISDRLCEYLGATQDYRNQYGLVHGTVDVDGVLMLADAMEWIMLCEKIYDDSHYNNLLTVLYNLLFEAGIEAHNVCLDEKTRSHAINAIYLPNINADALQTYLASKDIYIGVAHSACADSDDYRVLQAMRYSKDIARQTIRVSFSVDTTVDDIREFVNAVKNFKEMF